MKKKKNAFTLIELLAIIVILAIIAVITVPIILNVIENARKGASIDSAYNYKDAINKYYLERLSTNTSYQFPNGVYDIDNGELTKGTDTLNITVSGTTPTDGWIKANNEEIIAYSMVIGDYTVTMFNDEVTAVKNGEVAEKPLFKRKEGKTKEDALEIGDLLKFGDEEFYVINPSDENGNVVLLAHYNLNVGNNTQDEQYGKLGMQNSKALGANRDLSTKDSNDYYPGTVAFSSIDYWHNYSTDSIKSEYAKDLIGNSASYFSGNSRPYVYDSNSNLYTYVNNYKINLESIGANITSARLLTYEEATNLCTTSCLDWVCNTSFWLGSANSAGTVKIIWAPPSYVTSASNSVDKQEGVRPVIVIPTSEIENL